MRTLLSRALNCISRCIGRHSRFFVWMQAKLREMRI